MDRNTIVFQIDFTCQRNPDAPKGSTKDHELYINHELLSSHLRWVPAGEQEEVFAAKTPAPTNLNIVLAKLRPGQRVNMELHAVKGVGKDHAKFCPVGTSDLVPLLMKLSLTFSLATASYRLLPHIKITNPIPVHLAQKFQKCFSPGVIKIDPRTQQVSVDERNVRKDTVSREVLRHPEFADSVELSRVRDYFLCMCLCISSVVVFRALTEPCSLRRIGRTVCSGKVATRSHQSHAREVGCHHRRSCGIAGDICKCRRFSMMIVLSIPNCLCL